MIRRWLLLTLCMLPAMCFPQRPEDYGFRQIGNLPTNVAYDLLIDRKGYVWVAHELGVSRYNGVTFRNFHHPLQSSLGSSNLIEDAYGRIWYRNFNGQIFYIEGERVHKLQANTPDNYFLPFVILGDELLTRSESSLFIYNIRTRQSRTLSITPDNIPVNKINFLYTNGEKVFLLAHIHDRNRLLSYRNGVFTVYKHHQIPDVYPSTIISADDRAAVLSTGLLPGISIVTLSMADGVLKQAHAYEEPDAGSFLWANPDQGKVWVHSQRKSYAIGGTDTFRNLSLNHIATDREGNMWATSVTYGLLLKKRTPNWTFFPQYAGKHSFTKFGMLDDCIAAVTQSGELVYMDTSRFPGQKARAQQHAAIGCLPMEYMLFLYREGTVPGALEQLAAGRYSRAKHLKAACRMDSATVVIAVYGGMVAVTSAPDSALPALLKNHFDFDREQRLFVSINSQRIRATAYDSNRRILYAAFNHGFYLYTDSTVTSLRDRDLPVFVYCLQTYKNRVYAATQNNGVLVIEGDKITGHIDQSSGLTAATVLRIRIFGDHLWIFGLEDIQLYDLKRGAMISSVSLPPVKASQVSDLLEVNGFVYLATIDGLYKVALNNAPAQHIAPLNHLSSVIVNGTDTIHSGASLSWQKNNLQFNMDALYYTDVERTFFTHRLLGPGIDTNWKTSPPGQNRILLSFLPPGQYVFEARANTPNGLSAAEPVRFSFVINQPWWRQTWFICAVLLLVAGSAVLYARSRMRRRKHQNRMIIEKLEYEKALNESELKALKSQMNPHFIFNCLNTIQEMFMWGDKNAANVQMANFATLTRLILTVSEKRCIPLSVEVDILTRYLELEKMRFQENFGYKIIMDDEVDESYIHIPPMIVQPFVENSIKHGLLHREGAKELSISFRLSQDDTYLICTIRDNGIGRKRAAEIRETANYSYGSFSTEATKKRLQLIHKHVNSEIPVTYTDLKDDTGTATGTCVRIMIPRLLQWNPEDIGL